MKKILVLILVLILLAIIFIISQQKNNLTYQTTTINIGTTTISAEIADTPEKRELGLPGRPALPADRGLLFIFDQPARHGFWMKEMNFPIDIIWLDADYKIIGVTKNLRPDSYPQIFYPPAPIKYALETNVGLVPF